jgi:hypothetical protein
MKRFMQRIAIVSVILLAFSMTGSAQVIVKVRPATPVIVRTASPSARHMWVDGGWVVRGNNYVWVDGYWIEPKRGHKWKPGRWNSRKGGWVWAPGHWKK